ncbi:MAG TPA: metalloprotease PmbA [Gammaproteobacteria bacterium]|nr:metalloprotease PmbA [Gammaproteobacteria bacterium]
MNVTELSASLAEQAQRAVELARAEGADQAEAGLSHDEGFSVTVRLGELESVERQKDRSLGVTVYKGQRKGSASTNDFSDRGIAAAVGKALSIAGFTAADPHAGLADPGRLATNPPDLDLYHAWSLDTADAEAMALETEQAARNFDKRIENSEGASVSTGGGVRAYANSNGFVGSYASGCHSISISVVAATNGALERDYWYTTARAPDDLDAAADVGRIAAERAVRRLGSRQVRTRVVPVLFPAELARSLFGHFIAAIRGTSQYRRASFLLDCVGQRVFPDWMQIVEDPHIPRGMGSAPFDGEGVETRTRTLVENGVVQGLVLSSYSARRLGLQTTGNAGGVHNLIVEPNAESLESLEADCTEAMVVTEMLGQGVNTVTGDYSRGAAGYWVSNGKFASPVSEVTIAGNLRDMLSSIRAVGADIDLRGSVRCGAVLVDGMTVAGQ